MNKVKLAVLISAIVGTGAVFAQQTPPAKPTTQGTQTAQTVQQPGSAVGQTRGGMSAGAGQTAAGAAAAGEVTTAGLVGIAAAATVTLGLQSTAKH